jgi:hypothetical protein
MPTVAQQPRPPAHDPVRAREPVPEY